MEEEVVGCRPEAWSAEGVDADVMDDSSGRVARLPWGSEAEVMLKKEEKEGRGK